MFGKSAARCVPCVSVLCWARLSCSRWHCNGLCCTCLVPLWPSPVPCVALFVRGHLFPYAAAVRHCQLMPSLHCHYIDLVPTSTCVLSFHTAAVCSSIHGQYLATIVLMPTPCLHQVDVVHEQQISTYPAMECSMRKRSSVSTWTLKTMATK